MSSSTPIPLLDLESEYRELRGEIDAAITRTLDTRQFILGAEVAAFEEAFAAYCGVKHAICVNSGTSALHLALRAIGISPGDEVITAPFTFYATVAAIGYCGAKPVYADIDPHTFNLDPARIECLITSRTRAILPIHLYGQPADMDAILDIARRHKLAVIEDAAQAHGATWNQRRVGSLGDLGCFSFYPTKNLGAAGEGGIVTTNNPEFARTVRMLRDWGQEQKYRPVLAGYNYRMEGLQGSILRAKLPHLERWTEARRAAASHYDRLLSAHRIEPPLADPRARHVYHLYTVRIAQRDRVQRELAQAGIQTAVHYPMPLHLLPAYADPRYAAGDFPEAEAASSCVLSLPMNPWLAPAQIERAAEALAAACRAAVCDNAL